MKGSDYLGSKGANEQIVTRKRKEKEVEDQIEMKRIIGTVRNWFLKSSVFDYLRLFSYPTSYFRLIFSFQGISIRAHIQESCKAGEESRQIEKGKHSRHSKYYFCCLDLHLAETYSLRIPSRRSGIAVELSHVPYLKRGEIWPSTSRASFVPQVLSHIAINSRHKPMRISLSPEPATDPCGRSLRPLCR